jgi:hypothetical protein
MTQCESLKDDLLVGAKAIGDFIGKDSRQVFHMVSHGQLPAFKLGAVIHARKSSLRQHIAELEAASLRSGAVK